MLIEIIVLLFISSLMVGGYQMLINEGNVVISLGCFVVAAFSLSFGIVISGQL